jgi:hypothetical protein
MDDVHSTTYSVPLAPRRQYTLAGMLSYMLAVGVYTSMLTTVRPVLEWDSRPGTKIWPIFATVATAWCVLSWLYRKWRLPQARKVHYTGPVIVLALSLMASPFVIMGAIASSPSRGLSLAALGEYVQVVAFAMFYACGVSATVSLPAATLMLLYLMLPSAEDEMRRFPTRATADLLTRLRDDRQ